MRAIDMGTPSCVKPVHRAPFKPRPITAAEQAAIKAKADLLMFDGPSSRWQWPLKRDADVYCGFVNGKNRMGAYVGWTPFYISGGELAIIGEGDRRFGYELQCGMTGYIPKPEWLSDKKP